MTEERLEIALRAIRSSPELEARELLRDFAASVRGQAMIDFAMALEARLAQELQTIAALKAERRSVTE